MKVYGTQFSRAFRVLWMLEEIGMPYEHIPVRPHDSQLSAIYPRGKVPVIVDREQIVQDSTAILYYLANRYGHGLIHTENTPDRTQLDSLVFMILDEFDACVWAAAKHSFVLPKALRVKNLKPTLKWEFAQSSKAIVNRSKLQPFLLGKRLTLPDFIFAHCLQWATVAKFEIAEPALQIYMDQINKRPAYKKILNLPR